MRPARSSLDLHSAVTTLLEWFLLLVALLGFLLSFPLTWIMLKLHSRSSTGSMLVSPGNETTSPAWLLKFPKP